MDCTTGVIQRPIDHPIRPSITWEEAWKGPDEGLIRCWEIGRERAVNQPELARRCADGALPVLGWKGGHDRVLKKPMKYGSFKYLAQWQGLRGEDLFIDTRTELTLTCNHTGMHTTFTADQEKYANAVALME